MHDLDRTLRTLESEEVFETGDSELDPEIFGELAVYELPPDPPVRAPGPPLGGGAAAARRHTGRWIRQGHKILVLGV